MTVRQSDGFPGSPRQIDVEVVEDRTGDARCDAGFLRLRRLVLRNRYADGRLSEPYRYDMVDRDAMDAVVMVLATETSDGPLVCLRSALRPPLAFRAQHAVPLPPSEAEQVRWEVPAGLIEPAEKGLPGVFACAARETLEEVGLRLSPDDFALLGPAAVLSPGVMAEKLHFVVASVLPDAAGEPASDGSPVEAEAQVCFVPLAEALSAVDDGRIADVKTEVALLRFARWRELQGRGR